MQFSNKLLPLLLSLFVCCTVVAQENRFLQEVFDEVSILENQSYGTNFTIEVLPLFGQTIREQLLFDFYAPMNDTLAERPLIILVHGGNYLPQAANNTVYGERVDSSNVEIAMRLAKMGYAVAAIDHRRGWNLEDETAERRAWSYLQAMYRGIQDARTAIRFFRKDHAENANSYNIAPDKIGLWGIETGGYIALAAAYLNQFEELESAAFPMMKFSIDLDGDGTAETPMFSEAVHGDLFATSPGVSSPGTPYHPVDGDSLCSPLYIDYPSDFQLCVNMGGAIGDLSWINDGEVPVISFHVTNDPFSPYRDDIAIIRTTGDSLLQMQGSQAILEKASTLKLNRYFSNLSFDDPFTEGARSASAAAGHSYFEGLYPFVLPLNNSGNPESEPWQWWDREFWETVPFDGSSNFDEASSLYNADASPERARIYIDTIIGYFAPRALAVFNPDPTNIQPTITPLDVGLKIAPNPTHAQILFTSRLQAPIRSVQLFDLQGGLARSYSGVNGSIFQINKESLPAGMYIARLKFDRGIISRKIIFN